MKTIAIVAALVFGLAPQVQRAYSQDLPPGHVIHLPPGATVVGFDAHQPLVVSQPATTVQLPVFNFFTVSTSVLVPDRGGTALGGINSAASRSHWNGPPGFGQYGASSTLSGGNTSVGVQIIDLEEMDRQLRGQAAPRPDAAAVNAWSARVEQARQSSAGRPALSVAEARRLRAGGEVR